MCERRILLWLLVVVCVSCLLGCANMLGGGGGGGGDDDEDEVESPDGDDVTEPGDDDDATSDGDGASGGLSGSLFGYCDYQQIHIAWSLSPTGDIDHLEVTWSPETPAEAAEVDPAAGYYTISGLTSGPGTEYAIEVTAYGAEGAMATFTTLHPIPTSDTHVWYVDGAAAGGGSGLTWGDAFNSLTDALAAAEGSSGDDRIYVAGGVYVPSESGDRDASFELSPGVTVLGGFEGVEEAVNPYDGNRDTVAHETILSGDLAGDDASGGDNSENARHVVTGAQDAVLDGVTIRGGNADGPLEGGFDGTIESLAPAAGGGLLMGFVTDPTLGRLTIRDCMFESNEAHMGGGAFIGDSEVRIENTTFTGNGAEHKVSGLPFAGGGGGLYLFGARPAQSSAETLVSECVFSDNHATGVSEGDAWEGGGLYVSGTQRASVVNSTFTDNSAEGGGGGIGYWAGSSEPSDLGPCELTLVDSTFDSNTTQESGGAFNASHNRDLFVHMSDNVFTQNEAVNTAGTAVNTNAGGAVVINGGEADAEVTINQCWFEDNTAGGNATWIEGGAISLSSDAPTGPNQQITVENSVFSGNVADGSGSGNSSRGGAISVWEHWNLDVVSTTFYGNECDAGSGDGGAVSVSSDAHPCTMSLKGSILWDNAPEEITVSSNDTFEAALYCDVQGGVSGADSSEGNKSSDPSFSAPGSGDFTLQSGSPCIDAIPDTETWLPNQDIEGNARPAGSAYDMGAYEQ